MLLASELVCFRGGLGTHEAARAEIPASLQVRLDRDLTRQGIHVYAILLLVLLLVVLIINDATIFIVIIVIMIIISIEGRGEIAQNAGSGTGKLDPKDVGL